MSLQSKTISLAAPLPESIQARRTTRAGGSQRALGSSISHHPNPLRLHLHIPKNEVTTSQQALNSPKPRFSKSYLFHPRTPPTCTEGLPASAYNYQPYIPPPLPPVLPWPRRKLYDYLVVGVKTSVPVFLSCNLTNPVHLASILCHGCSQEVVEQVAQMMTPTSPKASRVDGVLVGSLVPEVMELLEGVFERRYGDGYDRRVEEVSVVSEEGDVVVVCAYVYGRR